MTRRLSLCAAAFAFACVAAPAGAQAPPAPAWAPAATAKIHPGVQLITDGGQCTANFVFYDATDVYIGSAAHCAEDSDAAVGTANGSCDAVSLPYGTPVEVDDKVVGRLVYSSYRAMADAKEADADVCSLNDFALVRIDEAARGLVNPTMPFWGGPTGLRQTEVNSTEKVLSYGNSGLRAGIEQTSPKEGFSLGDSSNGWSHEIWTATPGIFGDSGSGVIDGSGNALGILSTISLVGGTNNASDVAMALAYMERHSTLRLRLALGTEAFRGPLAGPGGSPSPPAQPQPDPTTSAPQGTPSSEPSPTPGPSGSPGSPSPDSPPPASPSGQGSKSGGADAGTPAQGARVLVRGLSGPRLRGSASGVARVEASLRVKHGKACFVLRANRRLVRSACGARTPWVRAAGTKAWSLRIAGPLRGRLTVRVRGLDARGRTLATATRRLSRR